MSNTDLCFMPATELLAAYRAKTLSPVEVIDAVIARIERLEGSLNAFAYFDPESARKAAQRVEAIYTAGGDCGALGGVPVTIKDLTLTADMPTQRGSRMHENETTAVDAPIVTRVKAADGVILGKTTTPEYGWKGVSESPLTGISSNPWKLGHNAGASSAGAGIGAAAGYGPLHQGSDGAGSIRMPAHFCGIFGLKPTFGRVPYSPVPNNDRTSHIGPMTRTVADAALFLSVLAGADPADHTSLEHAPRLDVDLGAADISNLRVAFSPDLGHARVDPDVAAAVADAVKIFERLGCHVEQVTPEFGSTGPELARFFWSVHEAPLARHFDEWREAMDPGLVACIEAGQGHSAEHYLAMRGHKLDYVSAINDFMQSWDLLLTPAVSVAAFPAGRLQPEHWPQHPWDWLSWAEFSYPFNLSGLPAASVPCGFTDAGLPVGLQIVGKRFDDVGVLRASAAFEAASPWADRRPVLE